MKLLYIHNVEVSEHTANLTQVVSMCKAFVSNKATVVLLLPLPVGSDEEDVKKTLRKNYHIEDEVEIFFFSNIFRNKKIRKFTHHFFLKNKIRKIKPDLCYTRDVNFLSVCLKCNIKTIYESHNFKIHNGSRKIDTYLKKKLKVKIRSRYYLFTVCISEMLKDYWVSQGIDSSRIIALHDGFIEDKYVKEISKVDARRELKLPVEDKLIMYTGNLYPNRGVDQVLNLAKSFKDEKFVVVGGPERFKEALLMDTKKEGIDNIIFTGQVPFSKIHLYQFAADINLGIWSKEVPTINYCSPLKIFEYMAAGRTIVSMGFPSIKEVLVDGKNAFVSNPEEAKHFADKLEEAVSNIELSETLAKSARKQAFSDYTWTKRVEKILQNI